jgi:hypothetical protein
LKPRCSKQLARLEPGSDDIRRYDRHWTPVHIDFHVDDFEAVLARALKARAIPAEPPIGEMQLDFLGQLAL